MSRIIALIIIPVVILSTVVVSAVTVRNHCETLETTVFEITDAVHNNDMEKARDLCDKLSSEMKSFEFAFSVFISEKDVSDLSVNISRLKALANEHTKEYFLSGCDAVLEQIAGLRSKEVSAFGHIY